MSVYEDESDAEERMNEQLCDEIQREVDIATVNGYPQEMLQRSLVKFLLYMHRYDWTGNGTGDKADEILFDICMRVRLSVPELQYQTLVDLCDELSVPPTFADWPDEKLSMYEEMLNGYR